MKDTVAELAIIRQTTHQGIRSLTLTELLLCVLGKETSLSLHLFLPNITNLSIMWLRN